HERADRRGRARDVAKISRVSEFAAAHVERPGLVEYCRSRDGVIKILFSSFSCLLPARRECEIPGDQTGTRCGSLPPPSRRLLSPLQPWLSPTLILRQPP